MRSRQFRQYQIVAIVLGLISFGLLYLLTPLSTYVMWLLALSLVTFLLYGLDKAEAKLRGNSAQNRVPKLLLHLLALLGGFVGGWAGRAWDGASDREEVKVASAVSVLRAAAAISSSLRATELSPPSPPLWLWAM